MEKMNDTMTICTLAHPNAVTIKTREYKELQQAQDQYERIISMICHAITLDVNGHADIDYHGRDLILLGLEILEPEALAFRVRQLKKEKGYDDDSMD